MSRLTAYDKFVQQALKYGFSLFGTPPTGQITSYRDHDDGYYKKGYPRTGPRFVDNGDGTITDHATGLMWAKAGDGAGCYDGAAANWNTIIDYYAGLTFAGHSDWRLPNLKELFSIVDYNVTNPCIDTDYFPNTLTTHYWTSSTYKSITTAAWVIIFTSGDISFLVKSLSKYSRGVRLGFPT